jgi:hypothetical protein
MILAGLLILVGLGARFRWGRKVAKHPGMLEPEPAAAVAGSAAGTAAAAEPAAEAEPPGAPSKDAPT